MSLLWESYKLDPYVKKLSDYVFQFAEKVVDCYIVNINLKLKKMMNGAGVLKSADLWAEGCM